MDACIKDLWFSMDPTLENGQIVVSIKTKRLKSGDVVAFWQGNKLLVKRVIACPGQKIDIDVNGKVSVDGKKLFMRRIWIVSH